MATTIKPSKLGEKLLKQYLLAPSIFELSLMTPKQQKKRIKKYLKDIKEW